MVQATVAIVTILLYTALVLFLGYWGYRKGENTIESWVTADKTLGFVVLLFTYSASIYTAYVFLGAAGFMYSSGLGFWAFNTISVFIVALGPWIIGTKIWVLGQRYNYQSPSDIFTDFYSKRVGLLVSAVMIVGIFPYIAIQLMASGIIFETATEGLVSFELGAAFLLIVGIIYIYLGGMRSIAWTDTVQGIFMFVGMWGAGFYILYSAFGGFTNFWETVHTEIPEYVTIPGPLGLWDPAYAMTFGLVISAGAILMPHAIVRFLSADSTNSLKWTSTGVATFALLIYVPVAFVALGGVLIFPEITNPDHIMVHMLFEYVPLILASALISGGIAAAMSSKDAQLHIISAMVVEDWIKWASGESLSEERRMFIIKVFVPIFGVISYIVALQEIGLIIDISIISFGAMAQLAPALIAALYWDRVSNQGAAAGIISGVLVVMLLSFWVSLPAGFPSFMEGFYGWLVNIPLLIIVSLLTESVPEERVNRIQGYLDYAINREWESTSDPEPVD